ncbi:MtrB/PioB family decaheme-associated outer membrane protein [Ferrimonas balearica]|uniref:MtrB/PioB family decaheme-associated outer membrane protein n=1 Tax=Ferrimonas balearica TaxID=44012 RepID=UPI001C997A7B|nr:MtrB/PioB family decaheme-associated outer membrane protein [Ferrimonas balearica]MBY5991042.1 MtrB/PioB family decaheme-associated outer membrane protein [Ferrimonas balearica]
MDKTLLATLVGLALGPQALAADFSLSKANTETVKWDGWECERCTPSEGTAGHFSIGVGENSIEDIHFANASGSDDDGLVLSAGADLTHWYANDIRTELLAENLGRDVSLLSLGAQRGNDFAARLAWQQLAWYDATVQTPFTSSAYHQLPSDWQTGATTGQMPGLTGPLPRQDLKVERDKLTLGLEKYFNRIRTYLDVSHQTREGHRRSGATLLTNSVNLAQPVDDDTTALAVGLNAVGGNWQVAFGYLGSLYRNDLDAQRWDNPYTPTFGGARLGQQALAPDNDAHQFHIQGTWAAGIQSVSGQLVWGRHDQDDDLLPATINGPTPPLPGTNADLQLDKLDLNLRYRIRPMRKMTLTAQYDYRDRDFRNPFVAYPYIITDSLDAGTRIAQPLDQTDQKASLAMNYRFYTGFSTELGYRWRQQEWDNQAADQADTNQVWATLRLSHWERLQLRLELGWEDRELDNYRGYPNAEGVNDDALRAYYLADRERTYGKFVASYQVYEPLSLQLTLEGSEEDYDDAVGLDEVQRAGYDVSLNWHKEKLNLYAFYNFYNIETEQVGSNTAARWQGRQDDDAQSAGLGVEYQGAFDDALDLGADLVWADSDTLTQLEQGLNGDWGDYSATRTTVDLYGRYHLSDQSSVQLDLLYQKYEDSNYLNRGLAPNSIGNALIFGDLSHDYSDYLLNLSYRHDF